MTFGSELAASVILAVLAGISFYMGERLEGDQATVTRLLAYLLAGISGVCWFRAWIVAPIVERLTQIRNILQRKSPPTDGSRG